MVHLIDEKHLCVIILNLGPSLQKIVCCHSTHNFTGG